MESQLTTSPIAVTTRKRDSGAAEDMVQETFLRLYEECRQRRSIGNLRSWVFQVGHNLAIDSRRRRNCEESAVETRALAAVD